MSEIRYLPRILKLFLMICFLSTVALGRNGEWPCWRGPNRDGKSADTGLLKEWPKGGPELLWKVSTIGKGFSTVAVSDGFIYTTGDVDRKLRLFAFDMSGSPKWDMSVDNTWTKNHPGSRSTPTVDGDRVFILSGHGNVVCFNAKTGERNWSKDLKRYGGRPGNWGYAESVLIYKDLVIAKPGGRSCVVALDKTTGKSVWQSKGFTGGPEYSSCVPFTHEGIPVVATGTRSGIACFSLKTGRVQWSNDWCARNTANCPDPAYSDGYVFWANGYRRGGICLKLEASGEKVSAEEVWTTDEMNCHHGGYIIHDGYIYGNHGRGWACLDLKTGERQWYERAVGKGSLCFADGMLYLFSERGGKAALATCSPEGLTVKGNVTVEGSGTSWAHPVVVGGRLYLRYADNLYCFNVKAK